MDPKERRHPPSGDTTHTERLHAAVGRGGDVTELPESALEPVTFKQVPVGLAIIWAETQLPGPVRKHALAMGSLQALLQKARRLLLQTATTWEAGRKTCMGF